MDDMITSIAVYPPIAITRVGDSIETDGFFYAPEIPGKYPVPEGGFKDKYGRIKRQAARFRVFGFDEQGKVVKEITGKEKGKNHQIKWTVHIANKKPSWYQFQGKLSTQQGLRNPTVQVIDPKTNSFINPNDRTDLIIDSKAKVLDADKPNERVELKGTFKGSKQHSEEVYLGETWVDEEGRLIVLGGHGKSTQLGDDNALILTDFDNPDWYDDTSDGFVSCEVTLEGKTFRTDPDLKTWVMCGPPKYTTDIAAPTTLYDIMENIYEEKNRQKSSYDVGQVIYYEHIFPVLERVCKISWVNSIADKVHGPSGPGNFLDAKWQERLTRKEPKFLDYKKNVLARLRFPDNDKYQLQRSGQSFTYFMPALSGDNGRTTDGDQTTWSSLTELQYDRFVKWANNDFELGEPSKYPEDIKIADDIEDLPERLAALVQSALEWTIGLPLYPGIEMSYPAEDPNTYELQAPAFYFNRKFTPGGILNCKLFNSNITLKNTDLTKDLSLPWQSDFYMCRNHWWPSARPDNILTEEDYEQVNKANQNAPIADRLSSRRLWERGLQPNHTDFYPGQPYFANTDMVHNWNKLGFISPTEREISGGNETIYVERERGQIVRSSGISNVDQLKKHLQAAMVVELTTIPLYLYALYSIKTPPAGGNTDATSTIRAIVAEEMLHLSLAGNMLLAIGGNPTLYDVQVVPSYPCNLPFRTPTLKLDLASATKEQIDKFIQIELPGDPSAPPESGEYHTIGQFYKAIEQGFLNLQDDKDLFKNNYDFQFAPGSGYMPRIPDAGGLVVVKDLATAQQAIANIVKEGEGFEGPYSDEDRQELSHYQRFVDMKTKTDTYQLQPTVISPQTDAYQYSYVKKVSQVFDAAYCYLLIAIEHLWKENRPAERQKVTYGAMYGVMMGVLAPLAKLLVTTPISPGSTQTAGPTFGFYDFRKIEKEPWEQLNDLILETIADYNSIGTSDEPGVGAQVNILITVQATIQQLYKVPLPTKQQEVEANVDAKVLHNKVGLPTSAVHQLLNTPSASIFRNLAQDVAEEGALDVVQGAALLLRTNGGSHLKRQQLRVPTLPKRTTQAAHANLPSMNLNVHLRKSMAP